MTYLATKKKKNFQNIINMPCGNFWNCATCHKFEPSSTITIDDGGQYFTKKINFKIQKSSWCHMLDFNGCMTINDVTMTSWV